MTIKQQYKRERTRIQRTIRNYEKRGLYVDINLPKIPKKITAGSVRRLKNISLRYIREKSKGVDYETGEVLSYYTFTRQQRQIKRKPYQATVPIAPYSWELALNHMYQIISDYDERAEKLYRDRISLYISQYGEKVLGMAVERLINEGNLPEPKDSYNIGYILTTLSYLDSLLNVDVQFKREVQRTIDEDNNFEEYEGEFSEW